MILPFPSRHLCHDAPSNVSCAHERSRHDGFSRRYNAKADHAFWAPVVRADLVHVAGVPDASAADALYAENSGDEHVWHGKGFGNRRICAHGSSSDVVAPERVDQGICLPACDPYQFAGS